MASFKSDYQAPDLPASLSALAPQNQAPSTLTPLTSSRVVHSSDLLERSGHWGKAELELAASLKDSLPEAVSQAMREPFSARALILLLPLVRNQDPEAFQSPALATATGPELLREILRLRPLVENLPLTLHMPLMDLCLPALRQLSPNQYHHFEAQIMVIIEEDQGISLFEYTLLKILRLRLRSTFVRQTPVQAHIYNLKPILPEALCLIAALAYFEEKDPDRLQAAFEQGTRQLSLTGIPYPLPSREACSLVEVDRSLDLLARAVPGLKKNILYACASTVMHDRVLGQEESELLR
ncbi:MAG: hypothetical protein HC904_09170, partial [Blastochloris sp.]|nr:hypothetical protein [Blastochloris sp.]